MCVRLRRLARALFDHWNWRLFLSPDAKSVCTPNDLSLSLSCTARAHVPKPTRRGGCRRGVAEPRLAICNRRAAAHTSMLTRQLGCRASARPCRLLARVSPPVLERRPIADLVLVPVLLPIVRRTQDRGL